MWSQAVLLANQQAVLVHAPGWVQPHTQPRAQLNKKRAQQRLGQLELAAQLDLVITPSLFLPMMVKTSMLCSDSVRRVARLWIAAHSKVCCEHSRPRSSLFLSQGVGVLRSLLPASLFEHLSMGQACNSSTQRDHTLCVSRALMPTLAVHPPHVCHRQEPGQSP